MAAAGIEDILITTEIAGSAKIERLMGLLRLHPEVKVVVDSAKGYMP
jgi:D-serine deaminase-like pyridoxal phosphate-dependent protein